MSGGVGGWVGYRSPGRPDGSLPSASSARALGRLTLSVPAAGSTRAERERQSLSALLPAASLRFSTSTHRQQH